ncbi:helix-turn-helix transcriptional regulator [Desulfosporosinus orientis]
MSIDLGHSPSYIYSIVSGKVLPSMTEFLYICQYFEISPRDFLMKAD